MRRRIVGLGGLLLGLLAALPAHAQEFPKLMPKFGPIIRDVGESPRVDATTNQKILRTEVKISPNTAMPILGQPDEVRQFTILHAAMASSDYIDPRYVENSMHPDDKGLWENLCIGWGDQAHRLVSDYRNFYLTDNMLCVGLAIGIAAPIANTHADIGIRNWYQAQAGQGRSSGADDAASFFKAFGAFQYAIPGYLALSLGGNLFPDHPWLEPLGQFGSRGLRALAVGAPMVGILQVGLGSDRPFTEDSRWHPFRSSHGVSGHAFVGAIPFLTAASMIDNRPLQALLFAGSLGTAWSRIHTDDHYFSQVLLGWTLAYLSVQAVNQTEGQFGGRVHIVPVQFPTCTGIGVLIQY